MKGARKTSVPNELIIWLKKENENWKPSYPFNESSVRNSVIRSLIIAQRGLCVYCGRRLNLLHPGKTFHVEHFRPQSRYESLSVSFENLFLSCGQHNSDGSQAQTCGTYKHDWFEEDHHVEPIYPYCTRRFRFLLNGKVESSDPNDDSAKYMITALNLNHKELQKEREQALYLIDSGELDVDDFWDDIQGVAESLAHVAFEHFGMNIP